MVPADWAAALSTPLRVVLPDCSRLSRRWFTARDHAETASFWAVVFPLEDRPDRARPQVSRPARQTRTPAKPAKTPRLKCSQPLTPHGTGDGRFPAFECAASCDGAIHAGGTRQLERTAVGSAENLT